MKTNELTNREKVPYDKVGRMTGKFRWVIGIMALLLMGAGNMNAQTLKTATGGAWNTGGNWNPTGVPIANDSVVIPVGVTVTQNVNTAALHSITIRGTLNMNTNNMTLNAARTYIDGGTLIISNATANIQASNVLSIYNSGTLNATANVASNIRGGANNTDRVPTINIFSGGTLNLGSHGSAVSVYATTININGGTLTSNDGIATAARTVNSTNMNVGTSPIAGSTSSVSLGVNVGAANLPFVVTTLTVGNCYGIGNTTLSFTRNSGNNCGTSFSVGTMHQYVPDANITFSTNNACGFPITTRTRYTVDPQLNVSKTSLSFGACQNEALPTESFKVSGIGLAGIQLACTSSDYEFSVTGSSGPWLSNHSINPACTIPEVDVLVRLKSTAVVDDFSGTINITSGTFSKPVSLVGKVSSSPALIVNPTSILTGFDYNIGGGVPVQSFSVSGICLSSTISVTLTNGDDYFEISPNGTGNWGSALTTPLPATGGPVHIRLKPTGLGVGIYNGTVSISNGGFLETVMVQGEVDVQPRRLYINIAAAGTLGNTGGTLWDRNINNPLTTNWYTSSTGCVATPATQALTANEPNPTIVDTVIVCHTGTTNHLTVDKPGATCKILRYGCVGDVYGDTHLQIINGADLYVVGDMNLTGDGIHPNNNRGGINCHVYGELYVGGSFTSSARGNAYNNLWINSGCSITVVGDFIMATLGNGGNVQFNAGSGRTLKVGGNFTMGILSNMDPNWYAANATNLTLELNGDNQQTITLGRAITVGTLKQSATATARYARTGAFMLNFTTYDQNCNPICLAGNGAGANDIGLSGFAANYGATTITTHFTGRLNAPTINNLGILAGAGPDLNICPNDPRQLIFTPVYTPARTDASGTNAVTYTLHKIDDPVSSTQISSGNIGTGATASLITTSNILTAGTYRVGWQQYNSNCPARFTNNVVFTADCGPTIQVTACTPDKTPVVFKDQFSLMSTTDRTLGTFKIDGTLLDDGMDAAEYILITPSISGGTCSDFVLTVGGLPLDEYSTTGWLLPVQPGGAVSATVSVLLNTTAAAGTKTIAFLQGSFTTLEDEHGTPVFDGTDELTVTSCASGETFSATVRELTVNCPTGTARELSTVTYLESSWAHIPVVCKNLTAAAVEVTVSVSSGDFGDYFEISIDGGATVYDGAYPIQLSSSADGTVSIRIKELEEEVSGITASVSITTAAYPAPEVCTFTANVAESNAIKADCSKSKPFVAIVGDVSEPQVFTISGFVDITTKDPNDFTFTPVFTGSGSSYFKATITDIEIDDDIKPGKISGTVEVWLDATAGLNVDDTPSANLTFTVDEDGNDVTAGFTITPCNNLSGVVVPFTVEFTAAPDEYCLGEYIVLSADITGPVGTYDYMFKDGTTTINSGTVAITHLSDPIATENISFNYPGPAITTGTVTLTVTDRQGNDSETIPVTITKKSAGCPAVSRVAVGTMTDLCPGFVSIEIGVSVSPSATGITYEWEKDNAPFEQVSGTPYTSATLSLSTFAVANAGKYVVTVKRNSVEIGSEEFTIAGKVTQDAPFAPTVGSQNAAGTTIPNNTTTCPNDVKIVISNYNGTDPSNIKQYKWYNYGTPFATTDVPTLTFPLDQYSTTYQITALFVDECDTEGPISSNNRTITIDNATVCDVCSETPPILNVTFGEAATASFTCSDCPAYSTTAPSLVINSALVQISNSNPGYALTPNTAQLAALQGTTTGITAPNYNATTNPEDLYFVYTNGYSSHPSLTLLTMHVPSSLLRADRAYRLSYMHRNLGTSVDYVFGGDDVTPPGSWTPVSHVLTSGSTYRTLLTSTTGLIISTSATTTGGGNNVRLGLDNFVLSIICPPTFTMTANAACGSATAVQLSGTAGSGGSYNFTSAQSITWYKKTIGSANDDGDGFELITTALLSTTAPITGDDRDNKGNVIYKAVVVTSVNDGGYTIPVTYTYNCQSATIEGSLYVCDGGTTPLTVAPAITNGCTYVWQKGNNILDNWTNVKEGGLDVTTATYNAPANAPGESYRVIFTAPFTGATPTESATARVEVAAPQNLEWAGINSNWNLPGNWKVQGTETSPAFAPRTCDNVTITTIGLTLPTLTDSAYCSTIRFLPYAAVGKVNLLNYDKAIVDMKVKTSVLGNVAQGVEIDDHWYMLTPPLKGMSANDYIRGMLSGIPPLMTFSYMRHFHTYIDEESTLPVAAWTASLNNDVQFVPGQGFVYKTATASKTVSEDAIITFPKAGKGDGRFITETDGITDLSGGYTLIPYLLDLSGEGGGQSGPDSFTEEKFVIVGNPFMSHLDTKMFMEENSLDELKIYVHGQIGTITIDEGDLVLSVHADPEWIAPMQAFLVPENTSSVNFIEDMLGAVIDGEKHHLRGAVVPQDILRIRAKQGDHTSLDAIVAARDGVSNSFKRGEDAIKLFSEEAPIEVTTLVDGKACEINKLDRESLDQLFVPINIKSTKAGAITLTIDGALAFNADNIYLYDNLTQTSTSLYEQNVFEIAKDDAENVDGRFFLKFLKEAVIEEPEPTDLTGSINNPVANLFIGAVKGNLVVQASSEQIIRVTVYDLTGRVLLNTSNVNSSLYTVALPADAAYLVKVVTDKQVKTGKVVVK